MIDLIRAAMGLQRELDARGLKNCVIGGIALQAWGDLRLTRDIDFSVLVGLDDQEQKIEELLALVTPRLPDAAEFALKNRVLLGFISAKTPVDIGLAAFPYEERMLERSVQFHFDEQLMLRVCSAEDLVVQKVFAGRPIDLQDVAGILVRQADLDWHIIESELPPLLEAIDSTERLQWLLSKRNELEDRQSG